MLLASEYTEPETAVLEAQKLEFTAKALPKLTDDEIATITDRKINIQAISLKAKTTTISHTENNLYGNISAVFVVAHGSDTRLKLLIDRLFNGIIESSFLGNAWLSAEIKNITIQTYSKDLQCATISAQLSLKHANGNEYRNLSVTSEKIEFPVFDIKRIVDEAIALIISDSKYQQTDLFGTEVEGDRDDN